MKKVLLVSIILLAFLVRVYKLVDSPAGLYVDELSIGYNAYSLVETGKDEHGRSWPLFFEAFGEYKLPVYIYSVALVQKLMGPIDASVRLPAVFFGTASVLVMYLFMKELRASLANSQIASSRTSFLPLNDELAIVSALLLALSPWHFQFTHVGFEASSAVFFLLTGLWLFYKAARTHSGIYLVGSLLSFVITLYAYNSARIVTPAVVAVLLLVWFKRFSVRQWLVALGIAGLVALPFIRFSVSPAGSARATQVSIFHQKGFQAGFKEFVPNYLANISPYYLFIHGDPTIDSGSQHRMGLVHLVELPFLITGLVLAVIKRKKQLVPLYILLVIGFVPPAVTTHNPHALRAIFVVPALVFLSALGIVYWLRITASRLGIGIVVGLLLLSFLRFFTMYHTQYVPHAAGDWLVGMKETVLYAQSLEEKNNGIYYDATMFPIAVLWHTKFDPARYHELTDKSILGNIHLNSGSESISPGQTALYITKRTDVHGELIQTIYLPTGQMAYTIWKLK